jgi:hypothetical protein
MNNSTNDIRYLCAHYHYLAHWPDMHSDNEMPEGKRGTLYQWNLT